MSMFHGPGARIYRNEAGEPTGWDYPSSDDPHDPDDYLDRDDRVDPDLDEEDDEVWEARHERQLNEDRENAFERGWTETAEDAHLEAAYEERYEMDYDDGGDL